MHAAIRISLLGLALTALTASAGCTALPDVPFGSLEAKYASPASAYLDFPGGLRLHYRDQGPRDAPPIILVHGFSASLQSWEPWVSRLSADYRVITLDLPGHGLTRAPSDYAVSLDRYAEVVDAVSRRLGLSRYVVAGNSMGGGVAWTLALRNPDRIAGLVLIDAVAPPTDRRGEKTPFAIKMAGSAPVRGFMRGLNLRSVAERGLKSAYVDERLVTPALVERYVDFSRAPGHRDILLRSQGHPAAGISLASLRAVTPPTLVMVGEADAIIPPQVARDLARAIPNARLVSYPGVGHVPMEQDPDHSVRDLLLFLDALPRAQ